MQSHSRVGLVAVAAIALGLVPAAARANVYAAHLEPQATSWTFADSGPLQITYRLNQPATSATMEVFRTSNPGVAIRTIAGCPTAYGLNTVLWDGLDDSAQPLPAANDYCFRVIVVDSVGTTGDWTNITPKPDTVNEIGDAQFGSAQGITVNRDPSSRNFGRIYISNSSPTASTNPGATVAGDGVYLLNNDMTFRGGAAASAAAAINAALLTNAASTFSPWKININQDNPEELVLGDDFDTLENVWILNGDGTTLHKTLDSTTTGPTTGANYTHGNPLGIALTGTGANRKLWVIDEDKDIGLVKTTNDLILFNIGETLDNYTGAGVESKNGGATTGGDVPVTNFYTGRAMQFGRINGTTRVYIACRRANNTAGNLAAVCYTLDENGIVTAGVWSLQNPAVSAAVGLPADITTGWTYTCGIAVDEARTRGAMASASRGRVAFFNTDTGAIIGTVAPVVAAANTGATSGITLDFDAAGNLYTASAADGHVRVWSPPDGPNSFTTPYYGTLTFNCSQPAPAIGASPSNATACAGTPVEFNVTADGHGFAPLTYTWRKGTDVVGTNSPTLSLSSALVSDSGTYTVTVSGCGAATSPPWTLTVYGPPVITQQPTTQGYWSGETATFAVTATTTTGTPTYQWKRVLGESTVLVGTNAPTLTIPGVTSDLSGAKYYVEVTEPTCGLMTRSADATINVVPVPCPLTWADADGDLDTDLADFGLMQACLGAGAPLPDACRCYNQDTTGGSADVIDTADLALFYACFTGPTIPVPVACGANVLFSDNFDDLTNSPTSPNWLVKFTTGTGAAGDYTAVFGYDYSAVAPPAPNSNGTSKGFMVSVNDRDDTGTDPLEAAIAFSNMTFSGDFTLRFDMWIQVGGSFTTEHAAFGVDADPIPDLVTPTVGDANGNAIGPVTSGYLFGAVGESGDTWRDYREYEAGAELTNLAGFVNNNQDATQPPYSLWFPAPKAFWVGGIGNAAKVNGGWGWMRVEVSQKGGNLTWKVNGNTFVSRALGVPTNGSIMLGHMDLYASVNTLTYVIYDNVLVTTP